MDELNQNINMFSKILVFIITMSENSYLLNFLVGCKAIPFCHVSFLISVHLRSLCLIFYFYDNQSRYQQIMKKQAISHTNACTLRFIKIEVPFDKIQHQLHIYEWRRRQSGIISYQWIGIQPYTPKSVLFVLNPIQKLTNLTQINFNKTTNALSSIFNAFSKLYQKFGPFEVCPQMIAFDTFFDAYVWINNEHTKNDYKREHISQHSMAQNILNILKNHNVKFEKNKWLSNCQLNRCYKLFQLSKHFNDLYQKQKQLNNKKPHSQQKILNFTTNKIKRKKGKNKISLLTKTTSFTSLKSSQDSYKITLHKPVSSIQLNSLTLNPQFDLINSNNLQDRLQVEDKRQELEVSLQFGQQQEWIQKDKVVSLQKLDSIRHFLVNSINLED